LLFISAVAVVIDVALVSGVGVLFFILSDALIVLFFASFSFLFLPMNLFLPHKTKKTKKSETVERSFKKFSSNSSEFSETCVKKRKTRREKPTTERGILSRELPCRESLGVENR
jgi:hypothetical protein